MILSFSKRTCFVAAAVVSLAFSAGAKAQSGPYFPPDSKGFRNSIILENYLRQHSGLPPVPQTYYNPPPRWGNYVTQPTAPTERVAGGFYVGSTHMGAASVSESRVAQGRYVGSTHMGTPSVPAEQVAVSLRIPKSPSYVAVRGPDGVVRNFPLNGGAPSIIVVGPGKSVTVTTKSTVK